jgi:hypothetical protein
VIHLLAVLLLVMVPLNLGAAVLLRRYHRRYPDVRALRERADMAAVLAVVSLLWGALGLAALEVYVLDRAFVLGVLAALSVLASVPNLLWLWLLLTGRFTDG